MRFFPTNQTLHIYDYFQPVSQTIANAPNFLSDLSNMLINQVIYGDYTAYKPINITHFFLTVNRTLSEDMIQLPVISPSGNLFNPVITF